MSFIVKSVGGLYCETTTGTTVLLCILQVCSYQVVLLVVHLGRVSPHAVDGQQQIHERKHSVEPQQVRPVQGTQSGPD